MRPRTRRDSHFPHSPGGYRRFTKIEHSLFYEKETFLSTTPTQPIENTDRVSDGSLWLSQPPQRGGRG